MICSLSAAIVAIGGLTRTSLVGLSTSLPSCCDHARTLTCTTTASVPLFLTVRAALRAFGERSMRIGLTSNEPPKPCCATVHRNMNIAALLALKAVSVNYRYMSSMDHKLKIHRRDDRVGVRA